MQKDSEIKTNFRKQMLIVIIILIMVTISYGSYTILKEQYDVLNHKYKTELMNNKRLDDENSLLEKECNNLNYNYTEMKNRFLNLEREYNNMENNYESMKTGRDFWYSIVKNQTKRNGNGDVARIFIMPNDARIIQQTKEILGDDYDRTLTFDDMEQINTWIHNNINYNYDTYTLDELDCYLYASETLSLGRGDCEDQAILFLSLCLAEENVSWLYCAEIEIDDKIFHTCCFADIEPSNLYFFDPTAGWSSKELKNEPQAVDEYRLSKNSNICRIHRIYNTIHHISFKDNIEFFSYI